jgi:hypothetical protein
MKAGWIGDQMKTCKTCKHSKTKLLLGWKFATCNRPELFYISPVTGKKQIQVEYCDVQRKFSNYCGPEGVYWESK